MNTRPALGMCGRCGHRMSIRPSTHVTRYHQGRGLCNFCYVAAARRGTLIDHERRTRTRDEVMAEWESLRAEGYSKAQAATRIGMTYDAFDTAFTRARRAGDARALPALGGSRRWWASDSQSLPERIQA